MEVMSTTAYAYLLVSAICWLDFFNNCRLPRTKRPAFLSLIHAICVIPHMLRFTITRPALSSVAFFALTFLPRDAMHPRY